MRNAKTSLLAALVCLALSAGAGCVPALQETKEADVKALLPAAYDVPIDAQPVSSAALRWDKFFQDPHLSALIGQALAHNQELHILDQEIMISRNEIMARRGEYLPSVGLGARAGGEVAGEHARELQNHGGPSRERAYDGDFALGLNASWEVDIWGKLRDATRSAMWTYMASVEGRRFAVTALVAEIARGYYELMALDNELDVIKTNIQLQQDALALVRIQKEAAQATALAVQRFEAEVLKNQSRQYELQQEIVTIENHLNLLVGRPPQRIARSSATFKDIEPTPVQAGLPTQLLENRPDVRRAELALRAAALDIRVARAAFYPSLTIDAELGLRATGPTKLFLAPESLLLGALGSLAQPLINRNAITANYYSANAKQIQAAYAYERTVLAAYTECATQLALILNLHTRYDLKRQQVAKLDEAIETSTVLFRSARADYLEVLTTRREALEAQLELVEAKKLQLLAMVRMYEALGGGWR